MLSHWLRMQQIALIVLLWTIAAAAQTAGSNAGQSQSQPEGWESGGYVIHQSIEIGYRVIGHNWQRADVQHTRGSAYRTALS